MRARVQNMWISKLSFPPTRQNFWVLEKKLPSYDHFKYKKTLLKILSPKM